MQVCAFFHIFTRLSDCEAQGEFSLPMSALVNQSRRARDVGASHWLSHEAFIQTYRKCRVHDWSYGTLPVCQKFDTIDMLNSSSWQNRYPSCDGSQQSPITIMFEHTEYRYFEPIQFLNYDTRLQLDVETFGTTVFFYPFGLDVGVFGGPLHVQYSFFMGTVHFGTESHSGSEHVVENKRYAAEMQLIHTTEITSDNDCLQEANGLLVLVILLEEAAENNQDLVRFLYALQELPTHHGANTISEFLMSSLVPRSTVEYYIYPGSLSFPPCTERVINVVFQKTVPIGRKQLDELRKLSWNLGSDASCVGPVAKNVRAIPLDAGVQPRRTIFRSFLLLDAASSVAGPSCAAILAAVTTAAVARAFVIISLGDHDSSSFAHRVRGTQLIAYA